MGVSFPILFFILFFIICFPQWCLACLSVQYNLFIFMLLGFPWWLCSYEYIIKAVSNYWWLVFWEIHQWLYFIIKAYFYIIVNYSFVLISMLGSAYITSKSRSWRPRHMRRISAWASQQSLQVIVLLVNTVCYKAVMKILNEVVKHSWRY